MSTMKTHRYSIRKPAQSEKVSETDFFDDFDDDSFRCRTWGKFVLILIGWSVCFTSIVRLGFAIARSPSINDNSLLHVSDWIPEAFGEHGKIDILQSLGRNLLLILLFGMVHSGLKRSNIQNSRYWTILHDKIGLDRAMYNFASGLTIHIALSLWTESKVYIWTASIFQGYIVLVIHILSWACLYGSIIIMDLPLLTGMTQVTVNSPHTLTKSPSMQNFLNTQRHMGLIPTLLLMLAAPVMSIERFILSIMTLMYMCLQWSANDNFTYVNEMRRLRTKKY